MKTATIAMVLVVGVGLWGCGDQKVVDEEIVIRDRVERVVDYENVDIRDGVVYEANSEKPFTGKAVKYWPNGQKGAEIEFLDGKMHGKSLFWYKSGQKKAEAENRDGKRHGKSTLWDEDGNQVDLVEANKLLYSANEGLMI